MSTALMAFLLAVPALAAPTAGLVFEAPPECEGQPEFVAAVASRGGTFVATPGASTIVAIDVRKNDHGYLGTFQVQSHGQSTGTREIQGNTCDEVLDALAVVTAIALNPDSRDISPALPSRLDSVPGRTDSPVETPTKGEPMHLKARSAWAGEVVDVPAGPLRFDPQLAWTLSYGATVGPIPSVTVPSVGLSFHLADFVTAPDGRQRIVGPILWARLGLSAPPAASYQTPGTSTEIASQSAALGICWSPLYDAHGLVVLGCLESGLTLMSLQTKGSDGGKIQSKTGGFGTAGPLVDVEYNLGSWLHLGARLGFNGIMGKMSAERADGTEIFHSRGWSAYGDLGLGFHF